MKTLFEKITPEQAGIDSSEVLRYIRYLNDNALCTHALLLLKGNRIFTEAYWHPFHKDFCHRQYSQTKSFVSMAIGLLVSDGKLSLDDRIADLFPEKIDDPGQLPEQLRHQTVRNMLTMCTAGDYMSWFRSEDPDRTHLYFNGRSEARMPGALWRYDSAGSQVLSSLAEKLTGKTLLEFLRERLFDRMGTFRTARMLQTPNGDTWGDSAMLCTARDMASFALLLMNGGQWNGEQLIDADYIAEATSAVVDNTEEHFARIFGHGYGYQIWRAPRNGFAFVGMGGQLTVILPEQELILVTNGDTQGNPAAYDLIVNGFLSFIADRMNENLLPPHPQVCGQLETTVSALRLHALQGKADSPLRASIHDKRYVCEPNRLGMTQFSFVFQDDCGVFRYTNAQGAKELRFGINKNMFGKFPQLGYSNETGRIRTEDGFMYDDAVSLRFTQDNKLQLRVQIIDKYFGNFLATFAFCGNAAVCKFSATAENFLQEYNGEFTAYCGL